ncbi:MAG: hypothetical protein ACREP8_00555, partial [Candidatus Binatia bacterium]
MRIYEGLTLENFRQSLADRPEKEEALKKLQYILSGGDPHRVDPGYETVHTAFLFSCRPDNPYRHLIPFKLKVSEADAELYHTERLQGYWEKKKDVVAKVFNLSSVQHPLAHFVKEMPVKHADAIRGLPAFDGLAHVLAENVPELRQDRELNVLYPGSGHHLAPLITAIKLIDEGKVDKASYIYTELDPAYSSLLIDHLRWAVFKGIFDQLTIGKWVEYPGNGSERLLELSYQGRPIRILFAVKRSGQEYYREEYLKSADLVILHDPGIGYLDDSFDLLAHLLLKRKALGLRQNQLVVMEGERKFQHNEKINWPGGLGRIILPGPYGHCRPVDGVGEIERCDFSTARA